MTGPFPDGLPLAGFDVPLEMLSACHARIERQCITLLRLPPHVAEHGADADARRAATTVMRYFDHAAPDHHADEEHDLFPALIDSMAGSDAMCIRQLIASLTHDHHELAALWLGVRTGLAQLAQGDARMLDAVAIEALVTRYRQHLARENAELLPMAARLLDGAALDRIGQAMQRRRGLPSK